MCVLVLCLSTSIPTGQKSQGSRESLFCYVLSHDATRVDSFFFVGDTCIVGWYHTQYSKKKVKLISFIVGVLLYTIAGLYIFETQNVALGGSLESKGTVTCVLYYRWSTFYQSPKSRPPMFKALVPGGNMCVCVCVNGTGSGIWHNH